MPLPARWFAALAPVLLAAAAAASEPKPFAVPPPPQRISMSLSQGYSVLDGGYADAGQYYSDYWDAAETLDLRLSVDFNPLFRAGVEAAFRSFGARPSELDDLHAGHARLGAALRLPLTLPAKFLADPAALASVRGPVLFLRVEAGLGVVDPTSDLLGRIYVRTFTWSAAVAAGIEYRADALGLFLEFGADLLGPPRPAPGRWQDPDMILSFPVAFGMCLYLP
jgi:hypothetical protein